jgi:hypothetical protein
MSAAVIAFPRSYTPRPREELELSAPQLAAYGSFITCQGDEATSPFTWERAIRMLIMIRSDHAELLNPAIVDPVTCHQALSRFAVEVARTAFGAPVELLRMVALLEQHPHLMQSYSIFLEAPLHLQVGSIDRLAGEAFAGILHDIAISEIQEPSLDLVYLLGKAAGPDEFDEE